MAKNVLQTVPAISQLLIVGTIHIYWFRIVIYAPYATWAYTSTYPAPNTFIWVRYIGPGAVLIFYTTDGLFRAGFQTHPTVTASTAAYATGMIICRIPKLTMMALFKIGLGKTLCRNPFLFREWNIFLSHYIQISIVSGLDTITNGIG